MLEIIWPIKRQERVAKKQTLQMAVIPSKTVTLPRDKPRYSEEDDKLGQLLNAKKNLAGWWVTPNGQVVIPPLLMRQDNPNKTTGMSLGSRSLSNFFTESK